MLYPKNVPNYERILRIVGGTILLWLAFFGQALTGTLSPVISGLLVFSAILAMVTGFIGWCPACALLGRKLKTGVNRQ